MLNKTTLYKKDSKGKLRIWEIWITVEKDNTYVIHTKYGVHGGNLIQGPDTVISSGKVKRTVEEQTQLQFSSMVKKQMDKGYVTNESGEGSTYVLPQLAYDYKKKTNYENYINSNNFLLSYKLDGVRVLIAKIDGEIVAYTRKSQIIKLAANHILPLLKDFFDKYPNVILDGELYKHGMSLQTISGIARIEMLNKWEQKGVLLTFNCFDVINLDNMNSSNLTRWLFLQLVVSKKLIPESPYFKLVPQKVIGPNLGSISNMDLIKETHDKAVNEGYEGAMIKLSSAPYHVNKRTYDLLKVKNFTDSEFEIVGFVKGNKREEDFVVTCKTEEGKEFEAQPTGTVAERLELLNELPKLIGKMATVKYFNLTEEGIPFLPKFKCVRLNE